MRWLACSALVLVAVPVLAQTGNGLDATYFYDLDFRGTVTRRVEAMPYLQGPATLPSPIEDKPFAARWSGRVAHPHGGAVRLSLRSNRQARLVLGGKVVAQTRGIEDEIAGGDFEFVAGVHVPVVLELVSRRPGATLSLSWGEDEQLVPQTAFYAEARSFPKPSVRVVVDGQARRLPPEGGEVRVTVAAESPYGPTRSWLQIASPSGEVSEAQPGQALYLPSNSGASAQTYQVTVVTVDPTGYAVHTPGPSLTVEAPERPQPVPDPPAAPPAPEPAEPAPASAKELRSDSPNRAAYEPMARETARRHGLDEDVFCRMIEVESNWNPRAVSHAGAQGLGQLMPRTAAGLGVSDPFDPAQNLDGAARYLAEQLRSFGTYRLALAAYNAGPGRVRKAGGVPNIRETQSYVRKILGE